MDLSGLLAGETGTQVIIGDPRFAHVLSNEFPLPGAALRVLQAERFLDIRRKRIELCLRKLFSTPALNCANLFADLAKLDLANVLGGFEAKRREAVQRHAGFHERREYSLNAVVVALRNGIELVIVTARAACCQTQKHRGSGVDEVRQCLFAVDIRLIGEQVAVGTDTEEAGARLRDRIFRKKLVACDLLTDKAIVGFVVVE